MKKIFGILIVFAISVAINTNYVFAQAGKGNNCSDFDITMSNISGGPFNEGESNTINFTTRGVANNESYTFIFLGNTNNPPDKRIEITKSATNGIISFSTNDNRIFQAGNWTIKLKGKGIVNPPTGECSLERGYKVVGPRCTGLSISQISRDDSSAAGLCFYDPNGGCLDIEHNVYVKASVINSDGRPYTGTIKYELSPEGGSRTGSATNGIVTKNFGKLRNNYYSAVVKQGNAVLCSMNFEISLSCNEKEDSCQEIEFNGAISLDPDEFSLCKQIPEEQVKQRNDCLACTGGTEDNEGNEGVWTAIGCIKRDPQAIIETLVTVGLSIGGGFALITFLAAGFIYSTSQGSPEKVKNAKEMMTASVVGILFIIFSVTILQFIGWSILKIPGFGG
jgi:hypothetical protein